MKRIVIIGGGIIGLACAWALVDNNDTYSITVVGSHFSPHTTSDGAGGIFEPYEAEPRHLLERWSLQTKQHLVTLMEDKNKGWDCINIARVHCCYPVDYTPYWKYIVDNWKIDTINKRLGQTVFSWDAPLIQTTKYINKLTHILKQKGVNFKHYEVTTINGLLDHFNQSVDLIVNCTGLGSKILFNDSKMFPIRGVLIALPPQPLIMNNVFQSTSKDKVTYVISREDSCFLGGTTDKNDYNRTTTPTEIDAIIERCCQLVPELKSQKQGSVRDNVVNVWVGLRPGRTEIRLEIDYHDGGSLPIIHCYGHGGSGWTTYWGSALDVEQLVKKCFAKSKL